MVTSIIVIIALLMGLLLWYSADGTEKYPLAWFIIMAAVLGSVVNEPYHQEKIHRLTNGWIAAYILWKSSVSIVFAFLFYLIAMGGLIGGDMFPNFMHLPLKEGAHWNMEAFVTAVKPESYKDIAKILVWSFIAGYSEKFVPNLIGKILKSSDEEVQK